MCVCICECVCAMPCVFVCVCVCMCVCGNRMPLGAPHCTTPRRASTATSSKPCATPAPLWRCVSLSLSLSLCVCVSDCGCLLLGECLYGLAPLPSFSFFPFITIPPPPL